VGENSVCKKLDENSMTRHVGSELEHLRNTIGKLLKKPGMCRSRNSRFISSSGQKATLKVQKKLSDKGMETKNVNHASNDAMISFHIKPSVPATEINKQVSTL
jgi:hypothetical protein